MVNKKSLENLKKFKPGQSGNKAGVSTAIQRGSRQFKESLFAIYKKNQKDFKKAILAHPIEAMKIIASICPKDEDEKEPIHITVEIKQVP